MHTDQVLGLQGQIVFGHASQHLMAIAFNLGDQLGKQFVCPLASPAFPGAVGHPFLTCWVTRSVHAPTIHCLGTDASGVFLRASSTPKAWAASSTYAISRLIEHL
jgi:hypothetical protein